MAGYKNGKIMLPIKEFLIVKGQATYELNTIDMTKVTVFYRKYNQEAFLETYSEMPKGDYRINEVGGNKQLEITNLDILDKYYSIQLARVVDLTSSPYSPSGQVDPITLNQHLNEVIADVTFLFTYLKDVGMVMDSSSGNKILAELKPYTTWYMDENGNMAAMPVDSLFEKFNDLVQELRQEVLKLLEQDLEVAERELLEEVKRQLDEYVETDLKQRLDDYTTQLEERLQTMIDQAVADKGLMPEGSDWLEIGLGNWLVVDLFNKNYIHYPPQLNSSDNAGVVKKDITDGGKSQVIRFYTTTGKMLFIVRVNEVWSEWQELGGQTDTMQFTQANHGFVFTAVTLDGATRQWVKANKYTSADGIAIKIDNDRFDVVTRGVVNIPTQARDDKGEPFVYDEYYFLSQEVDGGLSRTKNEIGTFQYLAHISEIDNKQVAYIDIGDSYDLDYEVVDTETADRVGIGTYKTTLRTADTIEDLKRLNLKEGDIVEVLGYYTKGDGANHKRKIESKDDGSGILLNNGLYANIIHNGEVNVSWFGIEYSGNTSDNNFTFDKTKAFNNYFILQKFASYTKASKYVIGIQDKIICTMGSCEFRKGNIEIIIDSDIKAIYGSQQNFTDGVQQYGHWLNVIKEWVSDDIGYPQNVFSNIIIDGVGSIETLLDSEDFRKHNNNCIGIMNVNNITIKNIRIPSSVHNGINCDKNSFGIRIENVDIRNCYTYLLKISRENCPYPKPDGFVQDELDGIYVSNSKFVPINPATNAMVIDGYNAKFERCTFDCRQATKKIALVQTGTCDTISFEDCIFDTVDHIVRLNGKTDVVDFRNCTFNKCTYMAMCNTVPALRNLIIRGCKFKDYTYSLIGIPQAQDGQSFNIDFQFNDLTDSTSSSFYWNDINSRNNGNIVMDYNTTSDIIMGYRYKPKATAVNQQETYHDFDLDEIKQYRTVFFTTKKRGDETTMQYTSVATVLFFSTSYPLTLQLNEECNLKLEEIESNKTLRVTPSNTQYKITLIGLS